MGNTTTLSKKKKKKTGRTRNRYTAEFKTNAVKLAMNSGTSVAAVARDLGVHEKSLYEWVASAKKEATGGLSFSEREELVTLRAELRRVKMERDILKKTAILFATESK